MNQPTLDAERRNDENPDFRTRVARTTRHVIEHDRKSWERLWAQMITQDRCLYRKISGLFRRA